jgi:site-specific recombinase XerD
MENALIISSPSQLDKVKPVAEAGFSFLDSFSGKSAAMRNYKPATIYKGQRWYIQYSFKDPSTNKFKRFKVYEDINRKKGSEQEEYAQLLKDAINYGLKNGYNPFVKDTLQVAVKNWTLIQGLNYFKQHLQNRGLRKRTIQSYESVLRMLYKELDSIKNENIKDVTKNHITSALRNAKNKNTWSNTTYNNNVTFSKAIFNFLIDEEILEVNPTARIKPLPQQITKHKYFDDATWKKIKENADPELMSFIMFLYHTGTRPNEARQLTSENILRDRKLLKIPAFISKNKKDDYVPLTDYVLTNYVQKGRLFKYQINYYGKKFRKLKKDLGLSSDHTLYSIKATRAIHLANDGADPYTIMQLFRHSGLDITMSYLRDLGININREATEKGIRF